MSSATSPQTENMGELGRLFGVFWSPGLAFRNIVAHPRWWPPLVLIAVMNLVFSYSFTKRVGWEPFMQRQIETSSYTRNMPADQKQQIIAQQAKVGPIMGYTFSVIGVPLTAVCIAVVFLVIFGTLMGAELSFRQSYAIVCYAMLPTILSTVMALAVMLMQNPEDFDLNYPTLTNIGAFLDPLQTPKWLLSLASSVDVFSLWTVVLLATGFASIGSKISWGTSIACVTTAWGVLVFIKMVWAAVFG
jgi:hypothetical protein